MSMNVDSLRTLHACLLLIKYYLFSNALICDKKTCNIYWDSVIIVFASGFFNEPSSLKTLKIRLG
jgi:hypothetical protein